MNNIIDEIRNYKSISIIGMDKNVGKTTTLNYIIGKARGKLTLGLTSIGRDGEEEDIVTSTAKPRIYVEKGSIIATAKSCFLDSDITKEILKTTSINTSMGEIIIFRCISDGYIQIAGPSQNYYIEKIYRHLEELGSDLILVDGALSRKSLASPKVTQATILCTGATLSNSQQKVVQMTSHTVNLLSIEKEKERQILDISKDIINTCKVGIIDKHKKVKKLDVLTSLDASKEIIESLDKFSEYIVINGILSDSLLEYIMKSTDICSQITFLVEDGTKLFISEETLNKLIKKGAKIKVINKINIIGISVNPKSPYGYEFDKDKFLNMLREKINLPVFDVVGGG
ncbi:lysine 5,6-aminomutase reactivase subunit KamB [Alkalithermobacter paradoxus]